MLRVAVAVAVLTLGLVFAGVGCKKKFERKGEGAECYNSYDCFESLRCLDKVCVPKATFDAAEEKKRLAAQRAAERAAEIKEQKLLEASGVEPVKETGAEAVVAPVGAGTAVRVVETEDRQTAFAACQRTERLISGGCSGRGIESSYPSSYSGDDTVGARWNCRSSFTATEVKAYALCQALPTSDSEAAPGPAAGPPAQ